MQFSVNSQGPRAERLGAGRGFPGPPERLPPARLQALQDLLADRPAKTKKQLISSLQEMLGVSLLDVKPKALTKALITVGDSNSGKTMLTDEPIATPLDALSGAWLDGIRAPRTLDAAQSIRLWREKMTQKREKTGQTPRRSDPRPTG